MVSYEQIEQVIRTGITRFIKDYEVTADRIQIIFRLDAGKNLQFVTAVDEQPKNTVSLEVLIGKNIYNFLVKGHIKNLLLKFCRQMECGPGVIDLMTAMDKESKVLIFLRQNGQKIRQITDEKELK